MSKKKTRETPEKAIITKLEALGAAVNANDTKATKKSYKAVCGVVLPYLKQAGFWRKYNELVNDAAANIARQMLEG